MSRIFDASTKRGSLVLTFDPILTSDCTSGELTHPERPVEEAAREIIVGEHYLSNPVIRIAISSKHVDVWR